MKHLYTISTRKSQSHQGSRWVQRDYCKIKITDSKKDNYSIKRYQFICNVAFVVVMQMSLKMCSSTGKLKEEILSGIELTNLT